jgi:PAS domain S-box-containing protein
MIAAWLDAVSTCVAVLDEDGHVLHANAACLERFGSITGVAFERALLSGEDATRWRQAFASGDLVFPRGAIVSTDDWQRATSWTFSRLEGVVIATGIEERPRDEHLARQQLHEREARLQLITTRLPVILWSTDAHLRITSILGAGVQAVGTSFAPQLSITDVVGPVESAAEVLAGQGTTFEIARAGRPMRVHLEPLRDTYGKVIGTVGMAFDISEEKATAEAHQELLHVVQEAATEWSETFDSISAPIVIVDDEGRVTRANVAALKLSGQTLFTAILGRPLDAVTGSPLWPELPALAAQAQASGETGTVRISTTDGRHWDVVASPWTTAPRTTIVASDVTGIARMQEVLQRSQRMSAVGDLVAGVAHELRNPLFGISATLDAFEALHCEDQFQPFVAALRSQVERMNELTHDLLEYGRPIPPDLQPGPIGPVIAGARASVRALAGHAGVTIDLHLPPELPPVRMDRQRLLQVFENLLKNAIQHSGRDTTVDVSATFDPQENKVIVLVEDRGPGFRSEDLERVFEPFFSRRRGGTGLGLSLVQRIVVDHGGYILAANREGGGAMLRLILPAAGGNE